MQNKQFIIGCDPGKMSGVCLIDITVPENPEVVYSKELNPTEFMQWAKELESSLESDDQYYLVVEDFFISTETAKKSAQHYSLHYIGVLKYLAWKYDTPIRLQMPSKKAFGSNDKLRKSGWWHVGGAGHANDSLRHALLYFVQSYPNYAKELLVD